MDNEKLITIILVITFSIALFIIIYTYYGVYKIMMAKCRVCGNNKLENLIWEVIKFGFMPWRKPWKFTCQDCRIKKEKKK